MIRQSKRGELVRPLVLSLFVVLFMVCVSDGAHAAQPVSAPAWQVTTAAIPTVLPPGVGRHGVFDISIENIGGASSTGEVNVRDILPAGLTVTGMEGCPSSGGGEVNCSFGEEVIPSGFIVIVVEFEVTGPVGDLTNVVSVTGGGAAPAVGEVTMRAGKTPGEIAPAGIAKAGFQLTGPAGEPFTQAAGHPTFLTTTLLYNTVFREQVTKEE
jgi:uncharacterized repeat protein (TIGR01451 family)